MSAPTNVYSDQVERVLPRVLSLFDRDPLSTTFGVGDRRYWAWRTTDFANGTFQGAAHGLARLVAADALPPGWSEDVAVVVDAAIRATPHVTDADGSLSEAFPREGSFCVTALVAFDLLAAIELRGGSEQNGYLDAVRPLVEFVSGGRETHAVISNHLATAAAALFRWSDLAGGGTTAAERLLEEVLRAQSDEGWFREYDGADPGYQSLTTYYLADVHLRHPELGLADPLRRSLEFLWHFAHPDGSFGGVYGSRDASFYVPAGIEALAATFPEAEALAAHMRHGIARGAVAALDALDEPNLPPFFNAWCWAATCANTRLEPRNLPCLLPSVRVTFPDAGIVVDGSDRHYTIASWHKGGVVYHFEGAAPEIDCGAVARDSEGVVYTTQVYRASNSVEVRDDAVVIEAPFTPLRRELPTPLQFAALRLGAVTAFRAARLRELFKRLVVRRLFASRPPASFGNRRTVQLGPRLSIRDEWLTPPGNAIERVPVDGEFSVLHMASQGYWRRLGGEV